MKEKLRHFKAGHAVVLGYVRFLATSVVPASDYSRPKQDATYKPRRANRVDYLIDAGRIIEQVVPKDLMWRFFSYIFCTEEDVSEAATRFMPHNTAARLLDRIGKLAKLRGIWPLERYFSGSLSAKQDRKNHN